MHVSTFYVATDDEIDLWRSRHIRRSGVSTPNVVPLAGDILWVEVYARSLSRPAAQLTIWSRMVLATCRSSVER